MISVANRPPSSDLRSGGLKESRKSNVASSGDGEDGYVFRPHGINCTVNLTVPLSKCSL